MRLPIVMSAIMMAIALLIDVYIYRALKRRFKSLLPARVYAVSACVFIAGLIVAFMLPRSSGNDDTLRAVMWILFTFISIYFAKLIFVIFDLIAAVPRLFRRKRLRPVSLVGVGLGVITFLAMWWGAAINRYDYQVKDVEVKIDNLPDSFDGYKIAQISDLHVGTFGNDTTFVHDLVDAVNALNPDMIVFTGDIVNRHTGELLPHVAPLSRLHARDGVYAILGNHDYGDYSYWPDKALKRRNLEDLHRLERGMGWNLLLNETAWLHRAGDSIAIIGVENVGEPPFHTYGSLPAAYSTPSDSNVKILLSHNPSHWNNDIANVDTMNIALTLSGHTHAMQTEILGLSPAAWKYKTWGGLYTDSLGRNLYVNIGAGTVGVPMRLGATPEITLFSLKKSH
ncbi:MAG: metallophosphoesterase [Muribaculaceae bacterium]|nr:metallophosphoesterase [Muribaculaceae bacterium]